MSALCTSHINILEFILCEASHHEAVWRSEGIAPHMNLSTLDVNEWSASCPYCFSLGERAPGTHDRRLGGPQSWFQHDGKENNPLFVPPGNRTPTVQPVA